MGDTLVNTARGTANIASERIDVNMSDVISMLEPNATPLLVLTKKLNTEITTSYKFEWIKVA